MKTTHLFYLVAASFVFTCIPCVYGVPVINVVPLSHGFGQVEVGSTETVVITIHNEGDTPIAIDDATFTGSGSSDYSITSFFFPTVYLGPGGQFDLTIEFAPSADGPSQATLEIESSDPDQPLVQVALTGEGTGGETTPTEQIEDINNFAQTSVNNETLVGTGRGSSARNRLNTFVKKLQIVGSLIEQELFSEACTLLRSVHKHCDGMDKPKDFVDGAAAPELAAKIEELITALDCD